ncbi:MAG TPA: HEAT repeat domain-containing protein, partial [Gemmataceae bacterium]|nr:HEAT repeat domain-containing protein [Gemmataceae bacterium]
APRVPRGRCAMGILGSLFGPSVEALKKKRDLEGLRKLLESKDPTTRREAAIALGELGDERGVTYLLASTRAGEAEMVEALTKAVIRSPQLAGATVRLAQAGGYGHAAERVIQVLDKFRDRISPGQIIEDLLGAREGLWWSRRDLRRIVLPFGQRAIRYLIERIEDPQKARRAAQLVGALGRAAGPAAPALIEAFRENPAIRPEVEAALMELYDGGLDALGAALDDADEDIRVLATRVLARMPRHNRERLGESPHSEQSEATIRARVKAASEEALDRALCDPSEQVRKASGA